MNSQIILRQLHQIWCSCCLSAPGGARFYEAAVADLRLRAGANEKYDVIDSVPKGENVRCYGYYTKERDGTIWLSVVYNGQIGFISKGYLLR